MASLAISVAGAAVSSSFGLGPQTGFLVGSVIGNLLFPAAQADSVIEGSRLGDLSVSASTYGTPIPLGYGTIRISGNIIWSTPIEEIQTTTVSGGGKGGFSSQPKQTQVTYSYFVNMAMSFAATEATELLKIWADGKVIYDKTDGKAESLDGLNFRFYKGDETQLPDSLIEADKGDGQVPGHRGLCYIVFDNLPLENFGNRIPNITAQISFKGNLLTNTADGGSLLSPPLSFQTDTIFVDYIRRRVYLESSNTLRIFNLDTMDEYRRVSDIEFSTFGGNFAGRLSGFLYTGNGIVGQINKYDPETFVKLAQFGTTVRSSNSPSGFAAPEMLLEAQVITNGVVKTFLMQKAGPSDSIGLLNADNLEYIWHDNNPDEGREAFGMCTSPQQQSGEATYFLAFTGNGANDDINIYQLVVTAGAYYDDVNQVTAGVVFEQIGTITSDTWENDGNRLGVAGPIYDQDDGGLIFIKRRQGSSGQIFKWTQSQSVVWSTQTTSTSSPAEFTQMALSGGARNGLFGWTNAVSACLVDTINGELIVDSINILNDFGINAARGAHFWDVTSQALVCQNSTGSLSGDVARIFFNLVENTGVGLDSIVEDLSQRAGYDINTDLDTTDLTDVVRGYVVSQQITYRSAIEPLAQAYFFDAVESDDQIKFIKKGGNPVLTIPQDDLVILGQTGEIVSEQRTQEVELPERLSVVYIDQESDYQQGTQSTKRMRQPTPVVKSRVEQSLALPIVLTPNQAIQISEKLLFAGWNERTQYKIKTAQKYLALDPGDIINIALNDGITFEARITTTISGVNYDLEIDAVKENAATFDSNAVGQGGLGIPIKPAPAPKDTRTFILNIPLLRDVDDTLGLSSRIYYGMNGYQDGWSGGALLQSIDNGSTYNEISRALQGVKWGTLVEALPATQTPYQTNIDDTFTVFMQAGDLFSASNAEFLNDVNTAIVGDPLTNNWEIIGYRDVTEINQGQYQISTILRAKRGTDVFVNTHVANEIFLPLDADALFSFTLPLGRRNQALPYKGVGFSSIVEDVSAVSFTGLGRDLQPYAPADPEATLSGGNINFTWIRRTRIGGELVPDVGVVPLAEAVEEYELEVLDATGTNVVRTFTAIPSPSQIYTNAQIIADFGFVPTSITFRVYQMSAVVGRGLTNQVTKTL